MLRTLLSLLAAVVILGLVYLFYPVFVVTGKPLLVVNMWNEEVVPRNFRMSTDELKQNQGNLPNLTGLKDLQASASGQFSENSLSAILNKIPSKQVTIVDLRQESHGFINGIAVSWFAERNWANKGKSVSEILEDEKNSLLDISKLYIAIVYADKKFPLPLWVRSTQTEEELTTLRGLGYLRIGVTDHLKPSDQDVDQFINFVKSLPKDSIWLHFHCAAGEGRASTFLTMYDMMRNATKVKLQDIFLRQHLLGGANFLGETPPDWRKSYAEERKLFVRQFYVYCQQNPLFQKSWTSWQLEQKQRIKDESLKLKK